MGKLLPEYFDHTILKADAGEGDVTRVCREALQWGFASVCVNGCYTKLAARLLAGSKVKVCTVAGFPLGMADSQVKAFEAEQAIKDGAGEIDMVMNIGALKDHRDDFVRKDIEIVKEKCQGKALLKVIIEACLLTDEEKIRACCLAAEAGADCVKTSTGFSTGGATVEDVALMKKAVSGRAKVKAAGGIRSARDAYKMIQAGADRLGTSATVAIMEEDRM